MTLITYALSSALIHFIWQGIVVAAVLWVTLFVLRNYSPNSRYAASCAALLVLALMPIVTLVMAYQSGTASPVAVPASAAVQPNEISINALSNTFQTNWLIWARSWALTVWSIGVLLFSVRLIWSCRQVAVLKRRGERANEALFNIVQRLGQRMGIKRRVQVLISSIADGPSVVGWIRPVILLPAATVLGLTPQQLDAVIAHELAHIRRHDFLVSALQVAIETLLFYHPAVWWTSSRIRHERELCCDDLAVRSCGDAICYARALTKLERIRVMKPSMVLGSTDGALLYRIQRLIGRTQEYGPSRFSGAVALVLGLTGLVLNLGWVQAESSPQAPATRLEAKLVFQEGPDSAGVTVNPGAAVLRHRTLVEYPRPLVERGIQGTVTTEVTIDATGNVVDARILSGPSELRKGILQSVLQWHFETNGSPMTQVVHVSFDAEVAERLRSEKYEVEYPLLKWTAGNGRVEFGEQGKILRETLRDAEEMKIERAKVELESKLKLEKLYAERVTKEKEKEKLMTKLTEASNLVLKSIRVIGLPEQSQKELLARLPVRIGETLNRESLKTVMAAIRQFDEHLTTRLVSVAGNEIELQILAPKE